MTEQEIQAAVDAHIALPRAERRELYFALKPEVRKRVRTTLEKRRGIAYRTSDGDMVLSPTAYDEKIAQLEARLAELPALEASLKNKVAELKNAKARHYEVAPIA